MRFYEKSLAVFAAWSFLLVSSGWSEEMTYRKHIKPVLIQNVSPVTAIILLLNIMPLKKNRQNGWAWVRA